VSLEAVTALYSVIHVPRGRNADSIREPEGDAHFHCVLVRRPG
jgi:hypothetical protein